MSDAEAGRSRDFAGYGRRPPDPRWPDGAHVAVNFVINYEEGGEYAVPDGDARLRDRADRRRDRRRQGPRPRGRKHVRCTAAAPASGACIACSPGESCPARCSLSPARSSAIPRRAPPCARRTGMSPATACAGRCTSTRAGLRNASRSGSPTEIITRRIGEAPRRLVHALCAVNVDAHLLLDDGYEYDSDTYDDELPYWVKVGKRATS